MFVEFKEGQKYSDKIADISDSLEHFKDAGYVLTEDDLIVDIDCLDKEVIQKMIQMFNIKTQIVWTSRGCHLYYKKPQGFRGANRICALGFPVEYKHIKNTRAVTIKRNGIVRDIENQGIREDLPPIFAFNKKAESLIGIDEGEGRNQKLFNHRMKLNSHSGWQNMLRFINNFIFSKPLDEDEFQTIVRDMKIVAEKDDEAEVAEMLIKKYKVIYYGGYLYYFQKGEYINDIDNLRRTVINEVGNKKTRYIDEIVKQMEYRADIIPDSKVFDVKFKNGILRLGKFIEVDSEEFTPYNIDINYLEDAERVPIVDEYINNLTQSDENYKNLLFEILAHSLIVDPEFKRLLAKFFIFVGDGGNGKGTLLTIIRNILNSKNCSSLSIKNMCDERYVVTMKGKLANLGDDIQDAPINDEQMKMLKNLSSCDSVSMRELYKQSRDTVVTATLIFTSNHILKTFEKGESYKRRVLWLPMYTKPKKKDPKFITKLTTDEALEYWIKLIMEGYFRLYKNGDFTKSQLVEDFNREYHEENDASLVYLVDTVIEDFEGVRNTDVYREYETWCEENDVKASRKMLRDSLQEKFGLKIGIRKINGKSHRVFVKREV